MTALFDRQRLWVFGIAILVGIGGILYGYDIGVVSGALLFIHQSIPMTDTQTGVIVGAVLGGGLVGTLIAGPLADCYGRRFVIAASSVIFIAGVALILVAKSFLALLIARLFLGVGVGIVAVAVPLYVAELVPPADRGKYVTFFQLFLTFGILLAYFVDQLFTASGNWRGMFAVVLVPAIILFIGSFKLPETPRWLVANGKPEKAHRVLKKTRNRAQAETDLIAIQNSLHQSDGTWSELFSQKLWLPLFIGISIAILNQWTGINVFLQYGPDILKQAGIGSDTAAMMGAVGIGALNFICTIVAIFLVDRIGRKPLIIFGVTGIFLSEVFLGVVSHMQLPPHLEGMLSLFGLFGFIITYAVGPGVVVWLALSELLPTRVRGKGMALCLFFNSLAGTLLASLFLDMRHWVGVSGTYWLCAGATFLYLLVAVFLLPETKGKTLEQIQQYFGRRKVAANDPVDSFQASNLA